METRLVETVEAVNGRGESRRLFIYQRMIPNHFGGSIPGRKEVFDEAGDHVNTTDGVAFKVVVTGEILMRV